MSLSPIYLIRSPASLPVLGKALRDLRGAFPNVGSPSGNNATAYGKTSPLKIQTFTPMMP